MKQATHIVGIDIGGTSIKAGYFRRVGPTVRAWRVVPTPRGGSALWHGLTTLVAWYRARFPVAALGVGCPGPLNLKRGVVLTPPHLPWRNFPLYGRLRRATGLHIVLDNDANAFTVAEAAYGAGRGKRNVVGLTLGTGVGGGIVIGGTLYHGRGNAGELGYLMNRGTLGGSGSLQEQLKAASLMRQAKLRVPTAASVRDLALKRGHAADKIWHSFGTTLGWAVGATAHVLDPDVVVVGGQIAKAWPRFAPALRRELTRTCVFPAPPVRQAKLGDRAGAIGAALLVAQPKLPA